MRTLLMACPLIFFFAQWTAADTIAPGMPFGDAKESLQRRGYEVDASKYGLAVASHDKNIDLDFCRIDDEITLALAYDRRTMKVAKLSLYFIPDHRTSKLQVVVRDALEICFEDNDVYTVKLKRIATSPKNGK